MTIMSTPDLNAVHHPVVARELSKQAQDLQLRIADLITTFAGSMLFVYLHVVAFAVWMLVLEQSPWPTLTLVVSLEAIFLSTFVMIGQNRQAAFQQAKADHDFVAQEQELQHQHAAHPGGRATHAGDPWGGARHRVGVRVRAGVGPIVRGTRHPEP